MNSAIQALVLSKEHFTKAKAEKWVRDHNFRPIKVVHVVKNNYRFRLKEPSEKYDYRMKHITTGIMAVIEYPK